MSDVKADPLGEMEQFPLDWLETASKSELLAVADIIRAARELRHSYQGRVADDAMKVIVGGIEYAVLGDALYDWEHRT